MQSSPGSVPTLAGPAWSLVQYRTAVDGPVALGVDVGGRVHEPPSEMAGLDLMAVLGGWVGWRTVLPGLDVGGLTAVSGPVSVVAPLTYPRKVLCAGANYYTHAEEMGTSRPDPNDPPFFFLKPPTTAVTGPYADVAISAEPTARIDWEAELGVVVADRCRDVSEQDALRHVAGYVVADDVSDRGAFLRPNPVFPPFGFDWLAHKGQDGFCPLGPGLVPVWLVQDVQDVRIQLWVNGVLKQDSTSADMVVGVAGLVAAASRMVTLEAGDVILTGTPAGVGMPRQDFLRPGDVVTVSVDGIGTLRNTMVAR